MNFLNNDAIRSLAWRIGRRLYCWARRDGANTPDINGEYWLIDRVVSSISEDSHSNVFIDIGANIGDWSDRANSSLKTKPNGGTILSLEPTKSTFSYLFSRFKDEKFVSSRNIAISELNGEATFYVVGDLAGTNSLIRADNTSEQRVKTQRFDDFVANEGLKSVLLVKSDTEGYDMSVIKSAELSFRDGLIDAWQFEYNHRWIANKSSLRDAFEFISDKPYNIGKVYQGGIDIFDTWHPELDRYFEANYIFVKHNSALERYFVKSRFDSSNVLVRV